MKKIVFFLTFAIATVAFGCSNSSQNSETIKPAQEVQKEDGSTVAITNAPNGTKAEARTFSTGEVSRATRITTPDGKRRALVEFRDGRSTELNEPNDIDRLMDASADSIKDAATKTWEATKAVGEKIGDKTADTAKGVGEATKDVASDAAEATGKGIKKAGKAVKKAGEKIKDKVTP
jgi:gas vesicle protein